MRPNQRRIFISSGPISQVKEIDSRHFEPCSLLIYFIISSLKLECEKLASEKIEIQRHYVMVKNTSPVIFKLEKQIIKKIICLILVLRDVVRPQC